MEKVITQTIINGLQSLGIKKGDTVLVHSDATAAFKLGECDCWSDALELMKQSFLEVIGEEGTLVVPTFYYDFCEGKPFTYEKSESQVGIFSNYILFDKSSTRSLHPIFSFSAIGPKAEELVADVPKTCFGKGSVLHRLHQEKAKMVFFNVGLGFSTFIHYIEESQKVDYRYMKTFTGDISKDGKTYQDSFEYYVRYLDKNVDTDLTKLEDYLLSTKKMKRVLLEDTYPVSLITTDNMFDEATAKLKEDPYFFLKQAPDLKREEV